MAEKTRVRALYIAEEAQFGVDPDPDGSDYVYVQADADLPQITHEIIESTLQNPKLAHEPPDIGPMKASMAVKVPLKGTGQAGIAAPALAPETDLFLKQILGGVMRGQGSAVGGGNASATNVLVTSSAGFRVGCMVFCTALSEWRRCSAIPDGTHVTVAPAFTAPPAAGNLLTGSIYYPVDNGHKTLAMIARVGNLYVRFLGGKGQGKLAGIGPRGRPTLEIAYEFDSFAIIAKPAALPDPVNRFPNVLSPIVKGAPFFYGDVEKLVTDLEFDFGIKAEFLESTYGTGNTVRHGMEVVDREPTGSFTPYYAGNYLDDLGGGQRRAIAFAAGGALNGFGFSAPRGQVKDHQLTDQKGVLASKVPFGVYDNDVEDEFVLTVL